MKEEIKSPIRHMVQGLAHWMAYRNEMSSIQLIEADAVFVATDILRAHLSNDFVIEREISKKSLPIVKEQRVDVGIKSKSDGSYKCLIEFKLADATNKGLVGDVEKLSIIKDNHQNATKIDCLVVILYRKPCAFTEPECFVNEKGNARKKRKIEVGEGSVKVRHVCTSFVSSTAPKSNKVICLEVI